MINRVTYFIGTLVFCLFALHNSHVAADETPTYELGLEPGLSGTLLVGIDPLSYFSADVGSSSNRVGFTAGARANYFFIPAIGLSIGADFVTRGFNTYAVVADPSASFIDVPLEIVFRYRHSGSSPTGLLGLGGYASLPLGNLTAGGQTYQTSKAALGFIFEARTMFPIDPNFGLGIGSWVKFGLSDSFNPNSNNLQNAQKVVEIGFGLAFNFR